MASLERDQNGQPTSLQDITVVMRNSLVAGNQSQSGFDIVGSLTTGGYNLFQNVDDTSPLFQDPDNKHATDKAVSDASFLDSMLKNNPGPDGKPAPTQTLALLPVQGNPAIDAIPVSECIITLTVLDLQGHPVLDPVTHRPLTITTDHDQRRTPRPDGHEQFCDIGAYESAG